MCKHGTITIINVDHLPDKRRMASIGWINNHGGIPVDSCIANEIEYLLNKGVITVCSCCSHGAGIPDCLIQPDCVQLAKELGYVPVPYTHTNSGYYQMILKGKDFRFGDD